MQSFKDVKVKELQKDRALYIKQYEAARKQCRNELDSANRVVLWQKVERMEQAIREVDVQISELATRVSLSAKTAALSSDPPEQQVLFRDGYQFKHYQIKKRIGQAAHAAVYLAYDQKREEEIALKVFLHATLHPGFLEQFEQQINILTRLNHEAIVRIYQFGHHDGRLYLVMPYLRGGSLRTHLQKGRTFSPTETRQILEPLAQALEMAAAEGISHMNINPDNVLLDEEGAPYLTNFGLAHLSEQTDSIIYSISDSFPYMAPEQWRGEETSIRTDIYRLGAIAFEMLTGKRPFATHVLEALVDQHLNAPIPPASTINLDLAPACDQVLAKAMAKAPPERYATPGEMVTTLSRAGVPPFAVTLGEKIGRYHLQKKLGHGGMAIVYLGHDPLFDRPVAVKIVSPKLQHDPKFRQRFEREARHIAAIEHNAIVPVYDFGEQDGYLYLVMRYMPGGSLRNRLQEIKGPMATDEIKRILQRLIPALEKAHSQGIIHCDIKPDNVLLDQAGLPYLSDFGIAHNINQTTTTSFKGAPSYMAPEQWRGEQVGVYTDIYQLGVMLFEMLCGERPFTASDMAELAQQHVDEPVPSVCGVNPNLPLACDQVLATAMAKAPQDRYATAQELAAALSRALITRWIGRYKIKAQLGRGGMAAVYLAHDPNAGRDVAIKMLPVSHTQLARKRFVKEAQTIARLEHETIVTVYAVDEHEGIPYLVMRYMLGGSLRDWLQKSDGPLPAEEVTEIIKRLADGLDAAHARKIIHCDIKPGNVLLNKQGQTYLSDFGIARHIDQTMTTTTMGTAPYMAPEQWQGEKIGVHTDIYQLGILAFEMLTGEKPFTAERPEAYMYMHLNKSVPSAHAINSDLPPACDIVLARATAKEPEERYESAGEFALALHKSIHHYTPAVGVTASFTSGTVPRQIGRYEIIDELGRGGMATVFLAYDPLFNRKIALKVVASHYLEDERARSRFQREARTIATLEHPAIVPVYDFGEQDDYLYLVMRRMKGGSLEEYMKQNGPLPLKEAGRLLEKLAPALDEAHARDIIHRDLKPANILLDKYKNPYLSDFGIAKLVVEGDTSLTQAGHVLGTLAYMSPEQITASDQIDARSDIYSLGVILFEMITGKKPYPADPVMGIIKRKTSNEVELLTEADAGLPPTLHVIFEKVLARDSHNRYATAGELAADMKQAATSLGNIRVAPVVAGDGEAATPATGTHPFIYDRSVPPDAFTGRQPILRIIFDHLRHGASIAITAGPREGKSSLLLKVAEEVGRQAFERDLIPSLVKLGTIDPDYTPQAFWQSALEPLAALADDKLQQRLQQAAEAGYTRPYLMRLFKHLGRRNKILVLLLDDFERLITHRHFQNPELFATMRTLATITHGLVVVLTSRLSVRALSRLGQGLLDSGDPFTGIISKERLPPFDAKSVKSLLNRAERMLSDEEKAYVGSVAGSHPFLLQAAAASLIEATAKEDGLESDVRFQERVSACLHDLWQMLEPAEKTVVAVLSLQALGGPSVASIAVQDSEGPGAILPELARRGVVRQVDQERAETAVLQLGNGTRWAIGAVAMAWWLRNNVIAGTQTDLSYKVWFDKKTSGCWLSREQWTRLIEAAR